MKMEGDPELKAAAERLRTFIKEHSSGGCKIISEGSTCQCPLCDVDRLYGAYIENLNMTQTMPDVAF